MNDVKLFGYLCADPDVREFGDGGCVASFCVGVNEKRLNREKEWVDYTTFVDVKCWGPCAKRARKVLCKGAPIIISDARLVKDEWTDKATGEKRSRLLVEMKDFDLCGGRSREGSQDRGEDRREYNQERPPQRRSGGGKGRGDDGGRRYSRRDEGEYYGDYEQEF